MTTSSKHNSDPVFHRDPLRNYPIVDHADGACLYDSSGKRYLDAAGGTFVINLGHTVPGVVEAMTHQANQLAFANNAHFTTEAEQDFARHLLALAPAGFNKAWICTSGSHANETAIKLARTFHLLNGEAGRNLSRLALEQLSRQQSRCTIAHRARAPPRAVHAVSVPLAED